MGATIAPQPRKQRVRVCSARRIQGSLDTFGVGTRA
ncbi:hypothetical protein ANO14919_047410 [Xylariales sp. No.14919]|nr:hypothetical protein ANO14919_047410 [Xylariales sp. No.14919]